MKTISATFNDVTNAQDAAQTLCDVGLDPHYVKVIAPHPDQKKAVAYRGNIHGKKGFSPEAADVLQGEALSNSLRMDFGAERSQDLLTAVLENGQALTIAQASDYLQKAALAALRSHGPLSLTSENVTWHKADRPGEPSAYGQIPTPSTRDFYGKSELDGTFRESEKMIDYEARRSQFYTHYNKHYAPMGFPFDRYEPAYTFGWQAATNPAWHGQQWDAVETAVKVAWRDQETALGNWGDVRTAVRYGWEQQHERK